MTRKPNVNSAGEKQLNDIEKQFDDHKKQIEELTLDRMNEAPKVEQEEQTRLSTREKQNSKKVVLKPARSIGSREKFNEKFREDYEFMKEYVAFTAENKEIIGETIEMWTKAFPGQPAEFWQVPVNTPVMGPRYLAEQITGCVYHRLSMDETQTTSHAQEGQYYGKIIVDNTVPRLTATPVSDRKSVFMGAGF